MRSALDVYGRALVRGTGLSLVAENAPAAPVPVHAWTSAEAPGDSGLLDRCRGPVLDVGCGPGRLAAALLARGIPALGVDIATTAVRLARARGALVLARSVYDRLPGERRWATVLLADGNVGIGGDPGRLFHRVARLLRPAGRVLVEVGAPGSASGPRWVRLADRHGASEPFPWARLSVDDVAPVAAAAGLRPAERWTEAGRWFAVLLRP